MGGAFSYPHGFLAVGFGIVDLLHHIEWYEVVGIAMDEEHRALAFRYLLDRGTFAKAPAMNNTAQQTGGVHQRELRKRELSF